MARNDQRVDEAASFQALFEQSPDALIFTDCEGVIRLWNVGAERVFGYANRDAIGRSLDVIIPERFRKAHWIGFRRAIESGSTRYAGRALTTRALHKQGHRLYVDLTFALIRRAGGVVGVLASGRDCTESYLARKAPREPASTSGKHNAPK